jgi:RNA polymerase sigma-70 factor, ECF subfamily
VLFCFCRARDEWGITILKAGIRKQGSGNNGQKGIAMNGDVPMTTTLIQGDAEINPEHNTRRVYEPDNELLAQCLDGDQRAFQDLVQQLMRPAYSHALALVGNHDDALDVSQEAFAKAWRSLRLYDPQRPFYAWYYVILKRQALNLIRSRKRKQDVAPDDDLEVGEQAAPEAEHRSAQTIRLVNHVLHQLSLADREIISMKDMHDLAYKDIAALLGIPIGTVMSRLYAARMRFRQKMQESGYEH